MQSKREHAALAQAPVGAGKGTGKGKGGPAARAAPEAQAGAKSKRKFGISLYKAWCKRCGICAEFCPSHALVSDEWGEPSVADEGKCSGCLQCMHRCPDFCVEVHEDVGAGAAAGEPGDGGE
jgi:2-oxoglutarate ferredoxin oxidoreductase subunit delta